MAKATRSSGVEHRDEEPSDVREDSKSAPSGLLRTLLGETDLLRIPMMEPAFDCSESSEDPDESTALASLVNAFTVATRRWFENEFLLLNVCNQSSLLEHIH